MAYLITLFRYRHCCYGNDELPKKVKLMYLKLDDMVDVMFSNKQFKEFLILRNQTLAANTNVFEKVAEEMNERVAADARKNTITHSQVRNKFKKLVCEWKSIRLSQRTVHGISCQHVEKGHEKWWDILFPLVGSRESADPSSIVQSCFDNGNQNTDPENNLGGSKNVTADKKGECKPKKDKETIEQFTNSNKILY